MQLFTVVATASYQGPQGTINEEHTYFDQTPEQVEWHRNYMKTHAPAGSTRSCTATAQYTPRHAR